MKRTHVFIHIPKTAGASVQRALEPVDPVIIGHDIHSPHYMSLPDYLRTYADREIFSFCFVRNPWDRLVSGYHYLKKGGSNEQDARDAETYLSRYADFDAFVRKGLTWPRRKKTLEQVHLKPQVHWVTEKGKVLVSWTGRFERLSEDMEVLATNLGVPLQLPHVNRSDHSEYRAYYTPKTQAIVAKVYADDIRAFGYTF